MDIEDLNVYGSKLALYDISKPIIRNNYIII